MKTRGETVSFKINGASLTLSAEEVRRALRDAEPEPLREHAADIEGTLFPVKQAFSLATGLDRLDFTTNQARTQLRRLGFALVRMSDPQ